LSAPRIEIALAVLIRFERTRVIGDFDVERLTAGRERHIGGERRHLVLHIRERRLTIGLAAPVPRQFKRDDLAFLFVEVGIVLPDADTLVGKAIGVALAVFEWLGEHLFSRFEREIIRRELFLFFPLPMHVLIHGIWAVDEIFQ